MRGEGTDEIFAICIYVDPVGRLGYQGPHLAMPLIAGVISQSLLMLGPNVVCLVC
jgi:hypothetical protein